MRYSQSRFDQLVALNKIKVVLGILEISLLFLCKVLPKQDIYFELHLLDKQPAMAPQIEVRHPQAIMDQQMT